MGVGGVVRQCTSSSCCCSDRFCLKLLDLFKGMPGGRLHILVRQMTHGAPAQGWYALFPLSNATTNANIIGWTGRVGGTLFEIGAYCMVVEAVNRGNAVRFGYEARPQ